MMEFKELAENLGLEEDDFLELVELFMDISSADIIKLESAIGQSDVQEVVEISHSLKGASGNLGFMDIYETAKGIEEKARDNVVEGAYSSVQSIKGMIEQISQQYERTKSY